MRLQGHRCCWSCEMWVRESVSTLLPLWVYTIFTCLILNLAYRKLNLEFQHLFLQERAWWRAKINTACKKQIRQTFIASCLSRQRFLYKMVDNAPLFRKSHYNSLCKYFYTKIEFFVWMRWTGVICCSADFSSVKDVVFWPWKEDEETKFLAVDRNCIGVWRK